MGNLAPAHQELPPPNVGEEEKDLAIALKSPQIRNAGIEGVKQALRYAMVKVGLRASNFPQEEEKAILLAHVVKEYGSHTADEIRLAFDMAIAGKLDIDHKDVVCYENFSCLYLSGIMNAYRKWSAQAYRHAVKELPAPTTVFEKFDIEFGYAVFLRRQLLKKLLPPLK